MYCRRCQQFQDDIGASIHQDQAPASHQALLFATLAELRAAYNSACHLCRRVFRCIDKLDWPKLNRFTSVAIVLICQQNKHGRLALSATFKTVPPHSSTSYSDKNPVKSARKLKYLGNHLDSLEHADPLLDTLQACVALENASTGSEASFEMARFWLAECLYRHPDCERDMSGWLPTRILDVGPGHGNTPRLVETANLKHSSNHVAFVALSHCWGPKQVITTTLSTLADRKRGIAWNELSKTFQDAVTTTRSMGQCYLWIDSLCIIQDSVQDWMTESVQMCTVYERAIFTIMAAHASGGDEGCFVKRDGLAQLPLTLQFHSPDKSHMQTACFQFPDHGQSLLPRFSPALFTRAWVLQEQFNSHARLIFFGEEVHWECRTMCGSEQRPLNGKMIWDLISGPGSLAVEEGSDHEHDFLDAMHTKWYELVKNYTRRAITKSSDRLIAIDGVAQSLQKRTSSRYLAGLWSDGLPIGLLWYIPWTLTKSGSWHGNVKETETYLSSRHDQPLAPTWTWASATFPIDWFPFSKQFTVVCDVLQAETQGTPFNTSGTLFLRGMTRRLFVKPYYQGLHFTGTRIQNPKIKELNLENMKDDGKWSSQLCHASSSEPSWRNKLAPYPIEFFPDEIFDHTQPVTFIAIGYVPAVDLYQNSVRHFRSISTTLSQRSICTLALQTTPEDPDSYRRVGFATWNNCSWFGYFCVSEKFRLEILLRLSEMQGAKGSIEMLKAIPILLFVWVWSSLFGQAVAHLHEDCANGAVWFRELVKGNGGKHEHDADIKERSTYSKRSEAEEKILRVV